MTDRKASKQLPVHITETLKEIKNFARDFERSYLAESDAEPGPTVEQGYKKDCKKIIDSIDKLRTEFWGPLDLRSRKTACLDLVASELEKIDPRLALAIDQISDRLEKRLR